jgi:hypothetical protein
MNELRLRDQGVAWTNLDGEVVALDEQAAVYMAANESGGLLWRALAEGTTFEDLVNILAREYGLETERAAADTDAFLAAMREQDLLDR